MPFIQLLSAPETRVHQQLASAEQKAGAMRKKEWRRATGLNYRFCHYAKGDSLNGCLSGYSQSLETKRPLRCA